MSDVETSNERPARGNRRRASDGSSTETPAPVMSFASAPRADLLPPEIGLRDKARGVRRALVALVFFSALLIAAGVAAAWFFAFSAELALQQERDRTQELLVEQQQFANVQQLEQAITLGEAAQLVGGSTEIDWRAYFARLEAQLPAGVRIDSLSVETATPIQAYPQSETPLEGPRIATLTFTASSDALPSIPDWLDRLSTMPGFVDATPDTVTLSGTAYKVGITMHIDARAYSGRFDSRFAGAGGDVDEDPDGVADGDTETEEPTDGSTPDSNEGAQG